MNERGGEMRNTNAESREEVTTVLEGHVVDRPVGAEGNRDAIRQMSMPTFGVKILEISRTDPPLAVESALLPSGKLKVLIGPNGAGKSTFFDAIMERGAFFDTRSGQGALVFGKSVHARKNSIRIARLDQEELLAKINGFTAREVLNHANQFFLEQFPVTWENSEAYEENRINQEVRLRIDKLTKEVVGLFGIDDFAETKVEHLSGGERTKLVLFMVLLSEPDLLLLDEPTNHLDLRSIAKLMALFAAYKKAGVSIVSVSHVDWFLRDAGGDGVFEIVNSNGRRTLSESSASYDRYMQNPTREQIPTLKDSIDWIQQDYGYKIGQGLIESSSPVTIKGTPVQNVSFPQIAGGELAVVSGDNGTGKTLLMEILFSHVAGRPERKKGVNAAYLPQFWPEEITRGSVEDFFHWIRKIANPHGKGSAEHPEQNPIHLFIRRLNELAFAGKARAGEAWFRRTPLSKLSGGEQRALWFIAVSCLRNIDMLVLDEPTNHMDQTLQGSIIDAIRKFPGAIMLSTHDRKLMEKLQQDGGLLHGTIRSPTHYVLRKNQGVSSLTRSKENLVEYIERALREARQHAKGLQI